MALLTAQSPVITGKAPTYAAPGTSNTIKYVNAPQFLIVKNTDGSPINVTVVVPGSKFGQANPDVVVAVPATTGERWIGPFDSEMAVDGVITVNISAVTGVTAALVQQ